MNRKFVQGLRFVQGPTPHALKIVRQIFAKNQTPLSTKEIFDLAVKFPVPPNYPPPQRTLQLKGQGEPRPGAPLPPHPDHPIRSISYLKHVILPVLSSSWEIEKFHTTRTLESSEIEHRLRAISSSARKAKEKSLRKAVDTWLWRPRTSPHPPTKWELIKSKDKGPLFGAEVGNGEDWGHLNKRRQRARVGKVRRDMQFMKELQRVKAEARKALKAGTDGRGKRPVPTETETSPHVQETAPP